MATPIRGSGGGGGKEKRGTSPSSSIIKKAPKPSSSTPNSSSSSLGDEKNTLTDTSKPVPNYLKPTISSSLDFSRPPRKTSTEAASAQKPTLNRRRSFERPPPSSQVNRAIRGPPSGTRDIKPLRSTSFSVKSTNPSSSTTRPASEKLFARASSLKDRKVAPHLTDSRSVKKSTLSSTGARKEPASSSSFSTKKPPRSVTSESSVDYESRSVDHLIIEDDFVNINYHEVQSLPEMSEMPESNKELADPTNIEMEDVEHLEEDPKESIVEEDHPPNHEDKTIVVDQVMEEAAVEQESENTEHQTVNEVATDNQPSIEVAAKQESENTDRQIVREVAADNQPKVEAAAEQETKITDYITDYQTVEEKVADNQPKVEAAEEQNLGAREQQDDSDKKILEAEPTETIVKEAKVEEAEEPKEIESVKKEETREAKDEKLVDETVSSLPADTAAAPVKTQASSVSGKKDKQDYNGVIEETATKLMGTNSRKNKVLALAGAFETVISLQDTKKS